MKWSPRDYSWTVFFASGLLLFLDGVQTYVIGPSLISRDLGLEEFLIGILVSAVAWKSFRRNEKWSWYVLWTMPLLVVLGQIANEMTRQSPSIAVWLGTIVVTVVLLFFLLLPYRKFFPRDNTTTA